LFSSPNPTPTILGRHQTDVGFAKSDAVAKERTAVFLCSLEQAVVAAPLVVGQDGVPDSLTRSHWTA